MSVKYIKEVIGSKNLPKEMDRSLKNADDCLVGKISAKMDWKCCTTVLGLSTADIANIKKQQIPEEQK